MSNKISLKLVQMSQRSVSFRIQNRNVYPKRALLLCNAYQFRFVHRPNIFMSISLYTNIIQSCLLSAFLAHTILKTGSCSGNNANEKDLKL